MKTLSFWKKPVYSALVFFGTVTALTIGYSNYISSLPAIVGSGSGLTAGEWNKMVSALGVLDTNLSNLTFSGGKVGIGTASPIARLHSKSPLTDVTGLSNLVANSSFFEGGDSLGASWGTAFAYEHSTGYPLMQGVDRASTTARSVLINPYGGTVGIGTMTPESYNNQAKLVVNWGVSLWSSGNGRHVYGWYSFGGDAAGYQHIKTSLWAGWAPTGNSQYIMGGWHILGYRYNSLWVADTDIYFHNWDGGYSNKNIVQKGNWSPAIDVYTSSDGYVVLRIPTEIYTGFVIDLHQFIDYGLRDIRVTATTFSTSATYY